MNYRLKRGIPLATEDLPAALNFLLAHNATYHLRLARLILTGFSAGAHLASLVAVTANAPANPHPLAAGLKVAGVTSFSGPVDGLDVVEQVFMRHEVPLMHQIGVALFPASLDYEPITYFDKHDPPFSSGTAGRLHGHFRFPG